MSKLYIDDALIQRLEKFISYMNNPTLEERITLIEDLTGEKFSPNHKYFDFYKAPASTRFHGTYEGGLVKHSVSVYFAALQLAKAFDMKMEDIDVNACIFHDLVKANAYIPKLGYGYAYNPNAISLPHGSESLRRMHNCGITLSSEAWEFAVAYHMGAFEHDNIEMYSKACDKYKEVLLLHTADMMATKIYKN